VNCDLDSRVKRELSQELYLINTLSLGAKNSIAWKYQMGNGPSSVLVTSLTVNTRIVCKLGSDLDA